MEDIEKKRSYLFYIMTATFWFAIYAYSAILSPYLHDLGVSYSYIGIICGSYGFAQMVLRLPLGIFSDRIGKRKIFVVLGVFCAAFSCLSFVFTKNPFFILLCRTLAGIAASAWVNFTVLFSSYFSSDKRSGKISYLTMWANMGQVSATFFGSIIAGILAYKAAFYLGAAVGFISLLMSFTITEAKTKSDPLPVKELLTVSKNKKLLLVSFLCAAAQMIIHGATNTFNPVIAGLLGASTAQIGLLATLSAVPRIIAGFISGKLFDKKMHAGKTLAVSFIIAAAGCAIIPDITNLPLLFFVSIICGFGTGLPVVLLTSLCIEGIEEGKRSTAMGFFQAVYGIGMFSGPVLVGYFSDGLGLKYGYLFCSAIAVAAAVISYIAVKNDREKDGLPWID